MGPQTDHDSLAHDEPRRRFFRSLRWELILRTLLPLGLLVATFGIVGQVGYTQVTESLTRSQNTEVAKLEAARVSDYLLQTTGALQQFANSPVLLTRDPQQIFSGLRNELISQNFDLIQVSDPSGNIIAASDGVQGGTVLSRQALEFLKTGGLSMALERGKLKDGRDGVVFSSRYIDAQGAFGGVVEGAVRFGSPKLGGPLSATRSGAGLDVSGPLRSGLTYLVGGDGAVLWHPDASKVGAKAQTGPAGGADDARADAEIRTIDGVRYIIGYAPLNLQLLLTQANVEAPWVRWFVITQNRWSEVVAPVNALLYWLVVLALVMFLLAVALVARSARALTVPVAKLVDASRQYSAGRLKHRLDVPEIRGPLEIEELAGQFNHMAEQLDLSYADLEKKVSDRTQELAAANSELARRLRESQTMQEVAAKFAGTAGLEEILESIASYATEALEAGGSVVFLPSERHPGQLEVAVVNNMPGLAVGDLVSVEHSLSGAAFTTGEPQISAGPDLDKRGDPSIVSRTGTQSILSAPLVSHGQVIGVINAINKRSGEFMESDIRLLTLLANQAAVAVERARLYLEARRQVEALETLNEFSLSLTASRSVEETLKGGLEHIGKLLGATSAAVFLHNERAHTLEHRADYNMNPDHLRTVMSRQPYHIDDPDRNIAALEAFRLQQPYTVHDLADTSSTYSKTWSSIHLHEDRPVTQAELDSMSLRSLVALPLTTRSKQLGAVILYFDEAQAFETAEVQLFQSFANILALAVYNTQLVAQTSQLATVEERARLARELHDSVTQSLFSLNLTLRAARRTLKNNPGQGDELLDNVQELAQGALAEMRALIFELRPQALANEGLVSALQKHADSVRARSGLVVHLYTGSERRLDIDVEEALYQIAREALHNVVKHAQAKEARITLDDHDGEVVLSVRDNGRGFDLAALEKEGGSHIGTSTMRERAEAIGGSIEFKSQLGAGTEVLVKVAAGPAEQGPAGEVEQRTMDDGRQAIGGRQTTDNGRRTTGSRAGTGATR
jgi:nitrate/nitrite-specific signal transduction histidine kinase